jgi:L(+)-tartrate dehydratase beta subunit
MLRCRPGTFADAELGTLPDQRRTAPIRFALHRIRDTRKIMTHHVLDMPIDEAQARALKAGDTVTLEKTLFGIRDATLIAMFDRGRTTRLNMKGHAVIHTAPNVRKVDPRPGKSSGYEPLCIGTTTSMRMERFTRPLMERDGVRLIIGKGGMGQGTLDAFRDIGGAYLAIVGGAAALETTWIEAIEEVDLDDLHPESLWKFRIKGFGPLLVTMDSHGNSLHAQVNADAAARRAAVLASIGAA